MSGNELPKKVARAELIRSEDVVGELQSFEAREYRHLFQGICQRVSELGISCQSNKMFSVYLNDEWIRLLCVPHDIRLFASDENSPLVAGQRLIVNVDTTDSVRDTRVVRVRDYMLCYNSDSMFELSSSVEIKRKESDHVWDLHAGSGPLIIAENGVATIHQGNIYHHEEFLGAYLTSGDLPSARNLLGTLNSLSGSCEDALNQVCYRNYNDL